MKFQALVLLGSGCSHSTGGRALLLAIFFYFFDLWLVVVGLG
jgi:hypothetical protein